ncbi:MAG TPA: hypothetical protein VML55_00425 [Planctomycetaceae bacterium]|nr:hypothetical protein [Planctomycetaceae bacterium]
MAGEHWPEAGMSEFEQALRTLALPASRIERDRLMFLAGRASAESVGRSSTPSTRAVGRSFTPSACLPDGREVRSTGPALSQADGVELRPTSSRWYWPAATVVSTCCAVVFGTLLIVSGGGPAAIPEQLAAPESDPVRPVIGERTMPEPAHGPAADQNAVAERPTTMAAAAPRKSRATAAGLFAFAAGSDDPSRLPSYLQMRRLVLEKGVDALASSMASGHAGEPVADIHASPAPTLRALDRPGHSEAGGDELFDGAFPAPHGGSL